MVNETHAMTSYRQGVLWLDGKGLSALSGVSAPEKSAPFAQWLERICRGLNTTMTASARIDPATLSVRDRDEWMEWQPPHGLWLPLTAPDGRRLGALLLARDQDWSDAEIQFLNELCHAYAMPWPASSKRGGARHGVPPVRLGSPARWPSPWRR